MKRKKLMIGIQSAVLLLLTVGMLGSNLKSTEGLGDFPYLLNDSSLEQYNDAYHLKYWSGAGVRSSSIKFDGSYSFKANGPSSGYYYLTQTLSSTEVTKIRGNKISFSFWFKGHKEWDSIYKMYNYFESARAEIRYQVSGTNYYEYGDWVTPKLNDKWYQATVSDYISSSATYVQLRIVGRDVYPNHGFNTYIDYACLSVSKGIYTTSNTYGKMACGYDLYSVTEIGGDYPYISPGTAAIAAYANPGYYVMSTKITISMEPLAFHDGKWWNPFDNDYYYTTQQGRLDTTSYAQGNNLELNVDPVQMEKEMATAVRLGGCVLDTMIGFLAGGIHPVAEAVVIGCDFIGANGEMLMRLTTETDFHDGDAAGYKDYSIYDKWRYPQNRETWEEDDESFVTSTCGILNFHWSMKHNTASSFKIKIKFEAKIGEPKYTSHPVGGYYALYERTTLTRTIYQTLYI